MIAPKKQQHQKEHNIYCSFIDNFFRRFNTFTAAYILTIVYIQFSSTNHDINGSYGNKTTIKFSSKNVKWSL